MVLYVRLTRLIYYFELLHFASKLSLNNFSSLFDLHSKTVIKRYYTFQNKLISS